jgi:uncharacterized protein (TIGR00255 family)
MARSMTGFGRAEGETGLGKVLVECRSVNHRFSDISIKVPKRLAPFEGRIKEVIRSEVSRGKVDLFVRLDQTGEGKMQLTVDFVLAEQYLQALRSMKERFGLEGDVKLEILAAAKDLIVLKEDLEEVDPHWPGILKVLKLALGDMEGMKRSEGETLVKDLQQRLERIASQLESIKERFPFSIEAYQTRLRERLQALLAETDIDPLRFQQEVAFLAERMDITEETVRAESHLRQFSALLKGEEPMGRKMDFILQEINREVNTIASKINDAEISQGAVEIKAELEKIREQVQNIE